MATPVFCCGGECGITAAAGTHISDSSSGSFSTTTVRSGARSFRTNPTASTQVFINNALTASNLIVAKIYVRFTTLPNGNCVIFYGDTSTNQIGVAFQSSDSKIYPVSLASGVYTFGSTGATVTTGVWYRIDMRLNYNNGGNWTVDVQVDGVALTALSVARASVTPTGVIWGVAITSRTADIFWDDLIISHTTGDYPLGPGKVEHFVPTADGTHNVAGTNDFERSVTGTDINNATTTAFQLIDDVPLKSGTPTEFINLIAPPNATDYVEVVFGPAPGISTPTTAPRAVEAIVASAAQTTTTNNLRIALNDNGTLDDIRNATVGSTTCIYNRKHYAAGPAGAWTIGGGGNGDFTDLRMRCFSSDPAPDPYWASAMIEAEFEEAPPSIPNKIKNINQAVNRASTY